MTSDYARHSAETRARRRLSSEHVAEFFDSLEDTLGNYTTVLEYGPYTLRELLATEEVTDTHRRHLAERLGDAFQYTVRPWEGGDKVRPRC